MSADRLKRLSDIILSALAIAALWPLGVVVAAAVAFRLGRPVFFRQTRAGLHGKPFSLIKFRSMLPMDGSSGHLDDADRMTRFGRRLRSSSLDELPELLNVLRGEMSLVGPRPLLTTYLDRYDDEQARRHLVRPGLTGLAQVRGRNALLWDERLRYDTTYVDTRSARLDASILLQTFAVVFRRDGVSSPGHATAIEFMGTASSQGESRQSPIHPEKS